MNSVALSQSSTERILSESRSVDEMFGRISTEELRCFSIVFDVPRHHPRNSILKRYRLRVGTLSKDSFSGSQLVLIETGLQNTFVKDLLPNSENVLIATGREDTLKEWGWLNGYIEREGIKKRAIAEVVGVGGGLMLNVAAYLAEFLRASLIQIPTTVIGMADGSGGKVRLNLIRHDGFFKHHYKSFYEPNEVILDPRFLETLSEKQISVGLVEVAKHGVFQSAALMDFLLSPGFDPYADRSSLLKAVLWAASLKETCLRIDPEERSDGSHPILRAGHEVSDRIEEEKRFEVPHGLAVAVGIYRELTMAGHARLPLFVRFCERFGIPTR
jgi:3-dehydroquinate synthetase